LIDLVKVLPYTEIIHQLLFKCTRPKWISGDVDCKTQNWHPNVHDLVHCYGLETPHVPLHRPSVRKTSHCTYICMMSCAPGSMWWTTQIMHTGYLCMCVTWSSYHTCTHSCIPYRIPQLELCCAKFRLQVQSNWKGPVSWTVEQEPPGS
jgi:hypothetical protein